MYGPYLSPEDEFNCLLERLPEPVSVSDVNVLETDQHAAPLDVNTKSLFEGFISRIDKEGTEEANLRSILAFIINEIPKSPSFTVFTPRHV